MTDHFSTLSKTVPIALLPVRLEARYMDNRLGIRILPDLIHGDTHDDNLTALEIEVGKIYWADVSKAGSDLAETARAQQWLADQIGPYRALWVAKKTSPNPPEGGGDYTNPDDLKPIAARSPMKAKLLPKFWVLRIYDANMELQYTTRTDFNVAKNLCMAPSLATLTEQIDADDGSAHVLAFLQRQNLDWMVDFDKAIQSGMAFLVDETHLPNPIGAAIVCGIYAEKGKDEPENALTAHLQQQWYSRGVDILPQGTPTNNSDAGRTSFSVKKPDVAALFKQDAQTRPINAAGRAALLNGDAAVFYNLPAADITALALGQNFHCLFDRVNNANMLEGLGAWAMNTAIGQGMVDFYSQQILAHTDGTIRHEDIWPGIESHYRRWVRGNAYIPPFRIGEQPYGILPITSSPPEYFGWSDNFDIKFDHYLNQLIKMWMGRMTAPVLDPNATDGVPGNTQRMAIEAISDVLGAVPHPTNLQLRALTLHIEEDAQAFDEIMAELDTLANRDDVPISSNPWVFFSNNYWEPRRATFSGVPTADMPNVRVLDIIAQRLQLDGMVTDIETYAPSHNRDDMLDIIETRLRPLVDMYYDAYASIPHVWAELADYGGISGASPPAVRYAPIPLLVGTTFSEVSEAIGDIVGDASALAQLRDYLLEMVTVLARGTLVADRVQVMSGEVPLLYQLLQQSYLRVPIGSSAPLIAAFRLIVARINQSLDAEENLELLKQELARILRETLGLLMHRLDAWVTSRAARDLAELRVDTPRGLALGGYGWLLDLRKSGDRLSEGFIHANSMNSATTAAVLRSGWSAYGTRDSTMPLSVNLSSERARNGKWILDGVRNGQDLSELLGARFERYLHDARLDFAIDDFRTAVSTSITGTPNANRVVDGLSLARAFSKEALPSETALQGEVSAVISAAPATTYAALKAAVDKITADLDSCADLAMAQTVFSLVRGDVDGAGASLSITGGENGVVPETTVLNTPREAQLITQRMLSIFGRDDVKKSDFSILGIAEPRLSHWLSQQLGDASNIQFRVTRLSPNGKPISDDIHSVADLGLTALDAATLCARQVSQTSGRLARLIRASFTAQDSRNTGELRLDFDTAGTTGISLNSFGLLATAMRDMVSQARPLRSSDLVSPTQQTVSAAPVDMTELDARLVAVGDRLGGLSNDLDRSEIDHDEISALAAQALVLNISGAMQLAENPTSKELRAKVQLGLNQRKEMLEDQKSGVEAAERLAASIAKAIPIVPIFGLVSNKDRESSLASKLRTNAMNEQFDTWWRKVRRVQQSTSYIGDFLDLSQALDLSQHVVPTLCQLPHYDEGWASVSKPAEDNRDRLCLYAVTGGTYLGKGGEIGGLVFDSWTEGIPRADHQTGIAYHYDTPSARAPQCVLLSVPGETASREDDLFDQLLHTLDLMKIRAVGPDKLKVSPREGHPYYSPTHPNFVEPAIGQYLPITFLPDGAQITRKQEP
jgi:hypothetical protein